jgi:RNA polymerase sigma-70 factor (ECF subfamily)
MKHAGMATLPPRQREILLAARIEGELNQEIATRLGVSLRLVEKELSAALRYCSESMRGMVASDVGPGTGRRKY